jgi:hypothetical protein
MKALWKLCLVVVVGVGGLAGQEVVWPPEGTEVEWVELRHLESDCLGGFTWKPDTAGYPITLSTSLINSEGEAWRAAIGGYYEIMRPDGSFTEYDINGVFIRSGTWFTIENFQIINHPYQMGETEPYQTKKTKRYRTKKTKPYQTEKAKPSYVTIVYYNYLGDDGKMGTLRSYFVPNNASDSNYILGTPRNAYFRTKAPVE